MADAVSRKKLIARIFIGLAHAIWMVAFTWLWLNFGPTSSDEQLLIRASTLSKRLLLDIDDDRPKRNELMFVNVAGDVALIPRADGNGKNIVTDREALANFLGFLKKNPDYYKYILCDIIFDQKDETEEIGPLRDSMLREALTGLPRYIGSAETDDNGNIIKGIFPGKTAVVEYRAKKGSGFLKFKLYQDKNKSLPLIMYEDIHKGKMEHHGLAYTVNGKPSFNKLIMDFKVRQKHILDTTFYGGCYTLQSLAELLEIVEFEPDVFDFMKKHKPIVIIGDFTRADVHRTVVGEMGGTLILLNAYLTLTHGDAIISPGLIFLLFGAFFALSYLTFYSLPFMSSKAWRKFSQSTIGKFITGYLSIAVFLIILTIISYTFFHVHINILIIAVYIKVLERGINWFKKRKERKRSSKEEEAPQEGPHTYEFRAQGTSMYKPGAQTNSLVRQVSKMTKRGSEESNGEGKADYQPGRSMGHATTEGQGGANTKKSTGED